jgi:hypothetical protein
MGSIRQSVQNGQFLCRLAQAALPINDDGWVSDRQIDAENAFSVCPELDDAAIVELEDYSFKVTTEERVDKARRLWQSRRAEQ